MSILSTPTKSQAEIDYLFTCLVADAIRHVNKFFHNSKARNTYPTNAEMLGEFCTALRRYSKDKFESFFYDWGLGNTQRWKAVAVPSSTYWNLCVTKTEYRISAAHADILCQQAKIMVNDDKTTEQEFREIGDSLNNLMANATGLEILVQKAKNLNIESNAVLERLYLIAQDIGV